jgi:putative membrane protein
MRAAAPRRHPISQLKEVTMSPIQRTPHALSLIAAAFLMIGTAASAQPAATAPAATSASGAAGARAGKLSHADTAFLKQAAQNGHAEVESSKLAMDKAVSADVKSFAKQMVDDHTKAGDELKALASSKGVEVPSEPSVMQKGKIKLLSARKDTSFDSHYAASMGVDAHQDTIKLFQKAADSADDAEVKAFAAKTLPTLQHHLQMAQQMNTAAKAADGKKP